MDPFMNMIRKATNVPIPSIVIPSDRPCKIVESNTLEAFPLKETALVASAHLYCVEFNVLHKVHGEFLFHEDALQFIVRESLGLIGSVCPNWVRRTHVLVVTLIAIIARTVAIATSQTSRI
jgi:hypothetical protein